MTRRNDPFPDVLAEVATMARALEGSVAALEEVTWRNDGKAPRASAIACAASIIAAEVERRGKKGAA